jgi:hypothetical protein
MYLLLVYHCVKVAANTAVAHMPNEGILSCTALTALAMMASAGVLVNHKYPPPSYCWAMLERVPDWPTEWSRSRSPVLHTQHDQIVSSGLHAQQQWFTSDSMAVGTAIWQLSILCLYFNVWCVALLQLPL